MLVHIIIIEVKSDRYKICQEYQTAGDESWYKGQGLADLLTLWPFQLFRNILSKQKHGGLNFDLVMSLMIHGENKKVKICKNSNVNMDLIWGKPFYSWARVIRLMRTSKIKYKQAEAEVVPRSSSVQLKIESDLVCLRFVKFNLD